MTAEGGERKSDVGKRRSVVGKRERAAGSDPVPFAEVMRDQGMAAPRALDDSMRRATGESSTISAEETLKAAERLLDRVLTGECEARDSALDLLTVDALVTNAMEIAAHDPKLLASFPELAMKRIAAR